MNTVLNSEGWFGGDMVSYGGIHQVVCLCILDSAKV